MESTEENKEKDKTPIDDTPVTAIVTFIGGQSVGKTSIIQRFLYDEFKGIYIPTLGYSDDAKTVVVNDITLRILCWDSKEPHKYTTLPQFFFNKAHGVVFMYSCTDLKSFAKMQKWVEFFLKDKRDDIEFIIMGNKYDLEESKHEVKLKDAIKWAK